MYLLQTQTQFACGMYRPSARCSLCSSDPSALSLRRSSTRPSVRPHRSRQAQPVTAASDKDRSWPRRSEPDAPRQDFSQDTSTGWDAAKFNSAWGPRFDTFKEIFFFRLATLGFGVRKCRVHKTHRRCKQELQFPAFCVCMCYVELMLYHVSS